jgi:hypothetical protein
MTSGKEKKERASVRDLAYHASEHHEAMGCFFHTQGGNTHKKLQYVNSSINNWSMKRNNDHNLLCCLPRCLSHISVDRHVTMIEDLNVEPTSN